MLICYIKIAGNIILSSETELLYKLMFRTFLEQNYKTAYKINTELLYKRLSDYHYTTLKLIKVN